ncbi:hypothetical protein KCU77_g2952, partial [Aureobasidium melanogenum]
MSSSPATIKMTTSSITKGPSKDKVKLLYNTHMVTIEVGAAKEHFVVHQSYLCAKSQYFNKALSGSFQEATTRFVQLPDVSPILFRIFVAWIYHDTLLYFPPEKTTIDEDFESLRITEKDLEKQVIRYSKPQYRTNNNGSDLEDSDDDVTGPSTTATMPEVSSQDTGSALGSTNGSTPARTAQFEQENFTTWSYDVLIRLYVFAHRFDVRQLRADSLDALISITCGPSGVFGPLYVRYIYQSTPTKSKLRDYTVHSTAYGRNFFKRDAHQWEMCPREFLVAVMTINGKRLPYKQCDDCYKRAMRNWRPEDSMCGERSREEDLAPYQRDLCFYHEHTDDEEREACRKRREGSKSATQESVHGSSS